MAGPTPEFWQSRFEAGHTPWDRGAANPQLQQWLDAGELDPQRIGASMAVPGCGSGYEVESLARAGFAVTALDYAPAAIALTLQRLQQPSLSASVVQADVLHWQPATPLDAIYEQTCLCALHPDHWVAYASQLHRWLRPGGRLFALFMQALRSGADSGLIEGPPYHCDIHAMRALFPAERWEWPKPPYARVPHPMGMVELALVLVRR